MSFAYELKDKIVAAGAATYNVDLFIGNKKPLPAGAGPFTTIIEYDGGTPLRTHGGASTQQPVAQILTRAADTAVARARAALIYTALGGDNGLHNVTLSGTFYQSLVPRQGVTDIGLDEKERAQFAFNVEAEKNPS